MIILGIDPGIARLGYAFLDIKKREKTKVLNYGCLETSFKKPFSQRLLQIYKELGFLINKYQPERIAIEDIYFAKNVKTAIKVSEVRGVVLLIAVQNNLDISEYTPLQVKQALTGYGKAPKKQMQKMVKIVLNLKHLPYPDDAADALAIALTCAQTININL